MSTVFQPRCEKASEFIVLRPSLAPISSTVPLHVDSKKVSINCGDGRTCAPQQHVLQGARVGIPNAHDLVLLRLRSGGAALRAEVF